LLYQYRIAVLTRDKILIVDCNNIFDFYISVNLFSHQFIFLFLAI